MTTYTDDWQELFGMTLDDWLCTGTVTAIPPSLDWDRVRTHVVDEVNTRLSHDWTATLDPAGTITSTSPALFAPGTMKTIVAAVRVDTIDSPTWMSQPALQTHPSGSRR
ncbi:hypothetical protein [Nocardia sp. SSK8]|uniref:hypothetical protein n=1 Tax=Nocardia sp. SSK8 TaxID=3120154 RepID=UPI003008F805